MLPGYFLGKRSSCVKGIIIGKQGKALKKVATEARKTLEHFFQKSVYLETFVSIIYDGNIEYYNVC